MKTSAGVWLDHREAIIVLLPANIQETLRVKSEVEKQLRRAGEPASGSFSPQEVPRDDSREREYQGGLARYYDEIIAHLRTADEILIFGPGEAKGELKKRMEKEKCHARRLTLETEDKMTEPQIVAHVQEHFEPAAPRVDAKRHRSSTLNQV
jgi:hypothetical protein